MRSISEVGSRREVGVLARSLTMLTKPTVRLFQAAMSEILMSWVDGNNAHITDGSRTLNRSIALANATMTEIKAQR